jgi:hypothetical protein
MPCRIGLKNTMKIDHFLNRLAVGLATKMDKAGTVHQFLSYLSEPGTILPLPYESTTS